MRLVAILVLFMFCMPLMVEAGFPPIPCHECEDGADGADGVDGQDGADGQDGSDGYDGEDGVDGIDGVDGRDGEQMKSRFDLSVQLNLPATKTIEPFVKVTARGVNKSGIDIHKDQMLYEAGVELNFW